MFRLFECCALSFFERFVLSFSLKIERFVSDSAEIWICGLYPEERAALNNYEYVNDTFHRQWEEMSEEAVDLVREEKILNGIMKKVRGRRFPFIKKSFYKYGMAAMIAVCMVLSA